MPTVTDTEYDCYLQTHVPKDQVVVVCVCNSRLKPQPEASSVVNTLTTLYTRLNRNRSSPCERVGGGGLHGYRRAWRGRGFMLPGGVDYMLLYHIVNSLFAISYWKNHILIHK